MDNGQWTINNGAVDYVQALCDRLLEKREKEIGLTKKIRSTTRERIFGKPEKNYEEVI